MSKRISNYKFFDKKIGSAKVSKVRANLNKVLSIELHESLVKKFK